MSDCLFCSLIEQSQTKVAWKTHS